MIFSYFSRTICSWTVILLSITGIYAQSPTEPEKHSTIAIHLREIETLNLEKVTLEEALEKIKKHWTEDFPGETFPVALISSSSQTAKSTGRTISMQLTKVPYIMALKYVCALSFHELHDHGEVISIQMSTHSEDWRTESHPVSEKVKKTLQIHKTISQAALENNLKKFAILFPDSSTKALWHNESDSIIMQNTVEQQARLKVILSLLDEDYVVSKEKSD